MNICIVCPSIFPYSTGGDTISIYLLAKSMKEHGHRVVVVTFDSSRPLVEESEIGKIYRYPGLIETHVGWRPRKSGNLFVDSVRDNEVFWAKVALVVNRVCRKEKPDIVHWYTFSPVPLARLLTSCPNVATVNTFWLTCVKGTNILPNGMSCSVCSAENLRKCLETGIPPYGTIRFGFLSLARAKMLLWERKIVANQVDKLITLSHASENLLEYNGISSSRINVIPNMYDPDFLRTIDLTSNIPIEKIKEEIGFDNGSFVVCFAGRIAQEKGIAYMINSIPLVLEKVENVVFAIAGKGPEEQAVLKEVKRMKLEKHVRLMGFLNRSALAKLYSASDIVVAPQICFEAFGRTILEAMLAKKPLITTNIGAPREFIQHLRSGIIIPPKDSVSIAKWIIRLYENEQLRHWLGTNARKYAEDAFSPENVAKEIEKLYRSLFLDTTQLT